MKFKKQYTSQIFSVFCLPVHVCHRLNDVASADLSVTSQSSLIVEVVVKYRAHKELLSAIAERVIERPISTDDRQSVGVVVVHNSLLRGRHKLPVMYCTTVTCGDTGSTD